MKNIAWVPFFLTLVIAQDNSLFISEYAEGSSNNKYLEIYNGTGADVDLSNYSLSSCSNGCDEDNEWDYPNNVTFAAGTIIANGDVYVVYHGSADPTIAAEGDQTFTYLSNGDDVMALTVAGATASTYTIVDIIGDMGDDPGSGWDVAGVTNGTKDHTLVRKSSVRGGNTSWTSSAGTNATDSEWIVHDQNTWSYLGSHTMIEPNLLSEGFENGGIPENWSVINNDGHPNSWYVYGSSLYAHTGNYSARVFYNPNGSNDWLITPKLDVVSGDSIVFWSKSDIGGIYA